MEQLAGEDARGTIGYVSARFEDSTEFAQKSASTRRDYQYCAKVARAHRFGVMAEFRSWPAEDAVIERVRCSSPRVKRNEFIENFIEAGIS